MFALHRARALHAAYVHTRVAAAGAVIHFTSTRNALYWYAFNGRCTEQLENMQKGKPAMKLPPVFIIITALTAAFLMTGCGERRETQKLHPSEAIEMISDSVMVFARRGEITSQNEFNAKRNEIAAGYLGALQEEGLDREAQLDYGKVRYWGGEQKRAREVFERLVGGDDATARNAYRELK